jgi:hypothetical protein
MRQSTPAGGRKARQSSEREPACGIAPSTAGLQPWRKSRPIAALCLRAQVSFVGGDSPLLAKRIGTSALAIAPEHVVHGHIDAGATFNGSIENGIHIGSLHVKGGRIDDLGFRPGNGLAHRVIDEEARVALLQYGMHDFPVRSRHAGDFGRAEYHFVKSDGLRGVQANQTWRKGVIILRNWFYWVRHADLLCQTFG